MALIWQLGLQDSVDILALLIVEVSYELKCTLGFEVFASNLVVHKIYCTNVTNIPTDT